MSSSDKTRQKQFVCKFCHHDNFVNGLVGLFNLNLNSVLYSSTERCHLCFSGAILEKITPLPHTESQ